MAQHDYVIANQSAAAFRADLNNALAAVVTQNSGPAEPSVTYAYMPWADTTAGLFKIRNAANTGWIALYQLNGELISIAGMRNLLINGNPTINQRGYVSGTATSSANQYTLDRWRVVVSGQALTWTDSSNVRTVTAPAGGVEQVIEGASIQNGTYTLSWTGTATATVNGNSVANRGQVILTGGVNAIVRFSGGTFSLPQLEVGDFATPFERRSIGQELMLCRRYYQQVDAEYRFDGILTTGGGNISYGQTWFFNPEMRATPTLTTVAESGQNSGSISWTPKSSTGALGTWEWQDTSSTLTRTKAAIVAASAEL